MPTDAHRARNKRHRQKLDQLVITVPKGAREPIKQFAVKKAGSFNAYIVKLIEQDMGCSVKDLTQENEKEPSQG